MKKIRNIGIILILAIIAATAICFMSETDSVKESSRQGTFVYNSDYICSAYI